MDAVRLFFISVTIIMQTLISSFFFFLSDSQVCLREWETASQPDKQPWGREPALWEVFEASTPGADTDYGLVGCSNAESEELSAAAAGSIVSTVHSSYSIRNRTKSTNHRFNAAFRK